MPPQDAIEISADTETAAPSIDIIDKDVHIEMPDGVCDAAFLYPAHSGPHPGVLFWPDAFGLRPSMRGIARRLAAEGYAVLLPNPYYRVGAAPTLGLNVDTFSFDNPDDLARLRGYMSSIQPPDIAEKDGGAYVAFLDAQEQVDKGRKIGTQGYCMGGALVFRLAAFLPDRIGAGATFHAGGLVTDQPTSPHVLVPRINARMYVGISSDDDARQPEAKDVLQEAFADAKVTVEIEVYPALHGWCVTDMPMRDGKQIYDEAAAEKAFTRLVALYKSSLD